MTVSKLTHGLELSNKLLLAPLGPLLPVCVDGAEYRTTWLPAVVHCRYIQVVHQHDVWVLQWHTKTRTNTNAHGFN